MADYEYFKVTPNCENGNVNIVSNLFSIQGQTSKTPIYENNSLDLTNDYLVWQSDDIKIKNTFLLRIWMKPSRINEDFCYLGDVESGNYIVLKWVRRYDSTNDVSKDYLYLQGFKDGNLVCAQRSQGVDLLNNLSEVFISIRKIALAAWRINLNVLNRTQTLFQWIENDGISNVEYNKNSTIDYEYSSIDDLDTTPIPLQKRGAYSSDFIKQIMLTNGVFQMFDITNDISIKTEDNVLPQWTNDTVMNCNFDNNINAGNINYDIDTIKLLSITKQYLNKDIEKGSRIPVFDKKVSLEKDLYFDINDNFIPNTSLIKYSLSFIDKNGEILHSYEYDREISLYFNACFLSDRNESFKLYSAIQYSSNTQNIPISVQEPIGRKYPIVIKNAETNYESGEIKFSVLGENFEKTHRINREEVVLQKEKLINFLTNGKTKFFSDWNGNSKIISVSSSPSISYDSNYGNGVLSISFSYVEQGNWKIQEEYYTSGLMIRKETNGN